MHISWRTKIKCPVRRKARTQSDLMQRIAKKQSASDSLLKEERGGEGSSDRGSFLPFHSSTVCSLSSSCLSVITGGGWKETGRHICYISVLLTEAL